MLIQRWDIDVDPKLECQLTLYQCCNNVVVLQRRTNDIKLNDMKLLKCTHFLLE